MLFKPMAVPDRAETQLAYKLKYFPLFHLSLTAKRLLFRTRTIQLTKADVLKLLDSELSWLLFDGKEYRVVWAHNNVPTEQEWNKIRPDQYLTIELRKSPAIPDKLVAIFYGVDSGRIFRYNSLC